MKKFIMNHFFNEMKKEIPESTATSPTKNNESDLKNTVNQGYVKEEVDIPWDEADQYAVFSGKSTNMFAARVIIDRLPDSIVQKYLEKQRKTIESHKSSTEDLLQESIASIDTVNLTANSPRKLRKKVKKKLKKNEANPKKIEDGVDSGFYWKICKTCDVKEYESIQCIGIKNECHKCKTRLIFECEECHKQLATVKCMRSHVRSKCGRIGSYYKCFKCDYKAFYVSSVKRHVKKMHSTMTSKMHCIEKIESDNVQNDLDNVTCKKFKCSKCEKKFEHLPLLMKHIQICTGKNGAPNKESQSTDKELRISIRNRIMFYCKKCDKDVKYNKLLRESKTRKTKCPDCKTFMLFKCLECQKQYTSRYGITIHIKSVHANFVEQEYKCSECVYKTSNFKHLCNHYRYMHIPVTQECSRCGKKFDKKFFLSRHLQKCGIEPKYYCDHCSYKSHYKNQFITHMFRHSTGNEIDCPKCKRTFKNKILLQSHRNRCGKRPNMKCDHCSYKTNYKNNLVRHILRLHSIEKQIECPICQKLQRNKQCLKEHLATCKLDFAQCKFCSFKTKILGVLRSHTLRHHAEGKNISSIIEETGIYDNVTLKEYRCDHCSFKSNIKAEICRHIVNKHLKEKNIKCSRCSDEFQNSVYLQRHLKYCGLTPYLHCEHCPFKTYLKGTLSSHMIQSHIPYECSNCKRKYHSKNSYTRYHGNWKRNENQCKKSLD